MSTSTLTSNVKLVVFIQNIGCNSYPRGWFMDITQTFTAYCPESDTELAQDKEMFFLLGIVFRHNFFCLFLVAWNCKKFTKLLTRF